MSVCLELEQTAGVEQLLQDAVARTTGLFQAGGTIFFLNSGHRLVPAAWSGLPDGREPRGRVSSSTERYVRQILLPHTCHSCVSASMEVAGGKIGEVVVFSLGDDGETYGPEDQEILGLLARRVARAVEDSRSTEEKVRAQQEALARIASALAGEVEVNAIAQTAVDMAVSELAADGAIVWQGQPEERTLTLLAVAGFDSTTVEGLARLSFNDPALASLAATTERIQVVEQLETVPDGELLTKRPFLDAGIQSIASVPLIARGELMGVLNFARMVPHRWTPGEQTTVKTIGDLLASAIYNARLYEESERRRLLAEAILDNSPVAIAVVRGADHRYAMVNSARERMTGIPRERILGKTLPEAYPDLAGTIVSDAYDRAFGTGEVISIPEFRYDFGPPAGARYVSLLYAPLRGPEGGVESVINLMIDVTEQVAARQRMEELTASLMAANDQLVRSNGESGRAARLAGQRAAELEATISNIADAVFVCDPNGRITLVNRAGLAFMPDAAGPEWPQSLVDYVASTQPKHLDGTPFSRQDLAVSRALRGEVVHGLEQVVNDPRTRRDRYLLVSASPIRDDAGKLLGAVEVDSDITRLKELDILKDQFMAVAAHEIKTPVTAIKGFAQALTRSPDACAPRYRGALDTIVRQSDRIDNLVKSFLEVSDMRWGRVGLQTERLELAAMVRRATARVAATTTRHRLIVTREDAVEVVADRARVEQVLVNLLHNAIRYSPDGGRVEVQVAREAGRAVVSVADHGLGIPEDRKQQLFERFYRAHMGTPFDYGGLGVGLYISRQIMQLHGGAMWFESEEGKGSTFYFSLPLTRRRATSGG